MNFEYPHPIIAREGWPFLIATGVVALVVHAAAGAWWALPVWLVFAFVLQFFRDPARIIPADPEAVLSPADGRVIAVEVVADPYAPRQALKISVFMNVFNVHSNRSPIDGTVERIEYHPGAFVNADIDKASELNERNALAIRRADGALVGCVQVAGLIARRILCYVREGDAMARGARFGFIRFGSRLDLYLPTSATPAASIGEKVKAASTVLAHLPAMQGPKEPD